MRRLRRCMWRRCTQKIAQPVSQQGKSKRIVIARMFMGRGGSSGKSKGLNQSSILVILFTRHGRRVEAGERI